MLEYERFCFARGAAINICCVGVATTVIGTVLPEISGNVCGFVMEVAVAVTSPGAGVLDFRVDGVVVASWTCVPLAVVGTRVVVDCDDVDFTAGDVIDAIVHTQDAGAAGTGLVWVIIRPTKTDANVTNWLGRAPVQVPV